MSGWLIFAGGLILGICIGAVIGRRFSAGVGTGIIGTLLALFWIS